MNVGDKITVKRAFHDGYRWVPAVVEWAGTHTAEVRLTDQGTKLDINLAHRKKGVHWRPAQQGERA